MKKDLTLRLLGTLSRLGVATIIGAILAAIWTEHRWQWILTATLMIVVTANLDSAIKRINSRSRGPRS